ncbi:MAG: ribulose-phosphate 3-epimerase, partial [Chloroflexi bacterium]|nr:ribulose-phosphate 3-epimerase [Chloroflexota bacterium]
MQLAPSILSADFGHLAREIQTAARHGAQRIHVDVMDGHFVPNLTLGPVVVQACRAATDLPLDVHLMMLAPERLLDAFAQAGADVLVPHVEATPHIHRVLQRIRDLGVAAGVALNPGTPPVMVEPVLHLVDQVLVMTVNPGFAGQAFLPEALETVRAVRRMADERGFTHLSIVVDGGINAQTAPLARAAGADIFVAGSAVFGHPRGVAAGLDALRAALG